MIFKVLTDVNLIYNLWLGYGRDLDIPYKENIRTQAEKYNYFGLYIQDHLAGLCTYKITRTNEVFIDSIIVLPGFESQNIVTSLVLFIYKKTESLIKTLNYPYKITVRADLPSNFYKRFEGITNHCSLKKSRGSCTQLYTYTFDTNALDEKLKEYNS